MKCDDCGGELPATVNEPHHPWVCITLLKEEIDRLRAENAQLRQRTSPETEPCCCPEFCNYHKRSRFMELSKLLIKERAENAALLSKNLELRKTLTWIKANHTSAHTDCPICMAIDVALKASS